MITLKPQLIGCVALSALCVMCSGGNSRNRTAAGNMAADSTRVESERPPVTVTIEKDLTYDKHTLADTYDYKDTTRSFQWDKVRDSLLVIESIQRDPVGWATIQNYKNKNGVPPLAKNATKDEYNLPEDQYGIQESQAIPYYTADDLETPARYCRDGALVQHLADSAGYTIISVPGCPGRWYTPDRYVKKLDTVEFRKAIFVDRTNQNIASLEKVDGIWYVRSMNPATTGLHRPPHQYETPEGIFVVQNKLPKMFYYRDGTTNIAGHAPWASRFTRGAYIHAVPLNNPEATEKDFIEFSSTLGTTPRSHMCVRTATSHAKFLYDFAPAFESLVVVFD